MTINVSLLSFLFVTLVPALASIDGIDSNGFLVYCPCMGRFGNQADHFLGSLNFAKTLNRTLILPPWIEYRQGELKSIQVPFDQYFQIEPLKQFHRVIAMAEFMSSLADKLWPQNERRSFCYVERKSLSGSTKIDCHAKEGNPFGPFWDEFHIDFVGSEFFAPLNYDTWHAPNMAEKWHKTYPADRWPVLAFTGAPATFPVQAENVWLQKFLVWTESMQAKATYWVKTKLPKGAYVGIHLRNGVDWNRACQHITDSPNLFSAAQCLGYRNENGVATKEMCMPSKDIIIRQIKRQVKLHNENTQATNVIKSIFVASDNDHMIGELNEALKRLKIQAFRMHNKDPHLDLIVLEKSNLFIGNCISSFSAFVIRSRNVRGFPSSFWAYPKESYLAASISNGKRMTKDEL